MAINEASYEVIRRSDLFRLLCTLDVPRRVAGSVVKTFFSWLEGSGPEWTVARLKKIHLVALQWAAGNNEFRLTREDGIKCHADGIPIGPFAWFFRNLGGLEADNRKLDTIFAALKMYSAVTLKSLTPKQFEKFQQAVENPNPDNSNWDWRGVPKRTREGLRELWYESKYDSLERWVNTPKKKVLHFEPGTGYLGSVSEVNLSIDQHRWDLELLSSTTHQRFRRLYDRALGEHCLPNDSDALARRAVQDSLFGSKRDAKYLAQFVEANSFVGQIGVIQERGAKARFVANPLRTHQVAISKLQSFLELCSKRGLPWDCTFDQEKGVRWIQRKLKEGRTLVATDLSSFTDQFPLSIIVSYLKTIGPMNDWEYREAVELLEFLSQQNWYLKSSFGKKRSIRWVKGIPLGLYAGFLAAANTHGMLLYVLMNEMELDDAFEVLGDDVIMVEELSQLYHHTLALMGCPINEQKTLTSDRFGEFASRLASESRILKQMKFPQVSSGLFSSSKPLELLEKYGPKAFNLVPSRFKDGVRVLASLPKSYGGLGWKPPKHAANFDAFGIKDVLVKQGDDPVPNVLNISYGEGRSIVIHTRRLSDRLMDLEVAYGYLATKRSETRNVVVFKENNNLSQRPIRRLRMASWQVQEPVGVILARAELASRVEPAPLGEDSQPSVEFQWEILHANSNLDDTSQKQREYRDHLRNKVAEFPSVSPREFILKENDHINFTSKLTSFRCKLQRFIQMVSGNLLLVALNKVKGVLLWKVKR